MSVLLNNLAEFVKMIFAVLVTPNYAASDESYSIFRYWFTMASINTSNFTMRAVILLTFGIALCGVSIGILKRFLWKS